ncbi:hypothetical protein [Variovorax boronicumulans]|uniref:hypothetical protein n=1 Tax=Variovorax boronicumulans TaxID=436515 RepID=UPI0012E4FDCD|nr:hypothetical protein [Variovorax boronicumulans]GER16700.1 phage associated protein [Variovorax boronicumulans]
MSETQTSTSNGQKVYQAIVDLMNVNRPATRKSIAEASGLKLASVDQQLRVMKDDMRITSPAYGVFELTHPPGEDRAITLTYMNNGRAKLEIEDQCTELSMREVRLLGLLCAGSALSFGR